MFTNGRSKRVIFVGHCVLNQNSILDGTSERPGSIREIVELLSASDVGIVQLPCPELHLLGLDRGKADGSTRPVVEENTRIRGMMERPSAAAITKSLVDYVAFQIAEYWKHGFEVLGIVGINRSPSCGVETTSRDDKEVEGEGVFIEALRKELESNGINVKFAGIKAFEPERAIKTISELLISK
jgi:predicted secreted protein